MSYHSQQLTFVDDAVVNSSPVVNSENFFVIGKPNNDEGGSEPLVEDLIVNKCEPQVVYQGAEEPEDEAPIDFVFIDSNNDRRRRTVTTTVNSQFGLVDVAQATENNDNPLPTRRKGNGTNQTKAEFNAEMDRAVSDIINESLCLFQLDPREYHPFYLRIYSYICIGKRAGYISRDEEVASIWQKYDEVAASQANILRKATPRPLSCEESPYATFIRTGKVIMQGKEVEQKRDLTEVDKMFGNLETAAEAIASRSDVGISTGSDIRASLERRLKFFDKCKAVVHPADCIKMNEIWGKLVKNTFKSITAPGKNVYISGKSKGMSISGKSKGVPKTKTLWKLKNKLKRNKSHVDPSEIQARLEKKLCSTSKNKCAKQDKPAQNKRLKVRKIKKDEVSILPTEKVATATTSTVDEPEPGIQDVVSNNEKNKETQIEPEQTSVPASDQENGKGTIMCPKCGMTFTLSSSLYDHLRLKHNPNRKSLQCPACSEGFENGASLLSHFQKTHTVEGVSLQAETEFENDQDHNESFPNIPMSAKRAQPTVCHICKLKFCGKVLFERHMFQKHGTDDKTVQCPDCPKVYKNKDSMLAHQRDVHLGLSFRCDICSRNMQAPGKLWKHKVEQHGLTELEPPPSVNVHRCEYCQEILLRGVAAHYKKKHPGKPFSSKFEELAQHRWVSNKAKNERRKIRRKLLRQQVKETGVGPAWLVRERALLTNTCPECSQKFDLAKGLGDHLRDVHGIIWKSKQNYKIFNNDPNDTMEDQHRYGTQRMLERDFATHRCTEPKCGKWFKSKLELQIHERENHIDIVQLLKAAQLVKKSNNLEYGHEFLCCICDQIMFESEVVKVHFMVKHQQTLDRVPEFQFTPIPGSDLLQCSYCQLKFGWYKDLREHVLTSHAEMCSQCPECSNLNREWTVIDPQDLQEHFLLEHSPESAETIEDWRKRKAEGITKWSKVGRSMFRRTSTKRKAQSDEEFNTDANSDSDDTDNEQEFEAAAPREPRKSLRRSKPNRKYNLDEDNNSDNDNDSDYQTDTKHQPKAARKTGSRTSTRRRPPRMNLEESKEKITNEELCRKYSIKQCHVLLEKVTVGGKPLNIKNSRTRTTRHCLKH